MNRVWKNLWMPPIGWSIRVTGRRAANRLWDLVGRAAGYCMATTWRPEAATYAPGFRHWRCWKRVGHFGGHRTGNYRWDTGRQPIFDPLPLNVLLERSGYGKPPAWLRGRHHLVGTRRRDRLTERMVLEQVRNRKGLALRPLDWGGRAPERPAETSGDDR